MTPVFKKIAITLVIPVFMLLLTVTAFAAPVPTDPGNAGGTGAAGNGSCPSNSFFFFPPWWEYLGQDVDAFGECTPAFTFPDDIWAVGLAIIDMLLRLAGFIAVIAVIISGVRYMGASGNPEKAASARKGLYNGLIGLFIALTATAVVAFIGNTLGS